MTSPASPGSTSVIIAATQSTVAILRRLEQLRAAAAWHELLVVDDGAHDGLAGLASEIGARLVRQPPRRGAGLSLKAGIREATGRHLLLIDADPSYQIADMVTLVSYLDRYELVIGARPVVSQSRGRSVFASHALNRVASYLTEQSISDLASPIRAAHAGCVREFLPLLPDGPSAAITTTLAFIKAGYSVRFEPISVDQAASDAAPSPQTPLLGALARVIGIYSPLRVFLPLSAAAFMVGAVYALWTIVTQSHVTNSSVVLILLSVVIFLVGLVSEQMSYLRFQGRPE